MKPHSIQLLPFLVKFMRADYLKTLKNIFSGFITPKDENYNSSFWHTASISIAK